MSLTSIAPAYYASRPHWDASKRRFVSPWDSAQSHGALQFIRARLFDWDEPPLPPKVSSKQGGAVLPPIQKPSWTKPEQGQVSFTWLGHAAVHLQIPVQGRNLTVLCDPVLSKRCSPFQFLGPQRYTDAPTSVQEMLDAQEHVWPDLLVLSHNHYDHLDYNTVSQLLAAPKRPHVLCTLGNKAWFQSNFNLTDDEVTECDWWDQVERDGLTLTCVPAQHFSGRGLTDRDASLWAGWTFVSPKAHVYFAGDTGYRSVPRGCKVEDEDKLPACPAFKEIGDTLGPFDLSLIPIGAYLPRYVMSTVHLAPQDSVRVHHDVKSRRSYGIHWGSFRLTPEDVNQPPQLLVEEAEKLGLDPNEFGTVQIGESVCVPTATESAPVSQETATEGDEPLPESKLGTKSHWDAVYVREVATFNEIGEEGEVWFGEDAVQRMIRFLEDYYTDSPPSEPPTVLDLGTGNGHLLFEMLESPELEEVLEAERMRGVDYSRASIDLARAVAPKRAGACEEVQFDTADLMNDHDVEELGRWDLVCDKGTLDAIALSSQPIDGVTPINRYTKAVAQLVKPQGIFLITSCNFTEDELRNRFTAAGFEVQQVVPTPSFTFGGAKGSTTTTIAFRRA